MIRIEFTAAGMCSIHLPADAGNTVTATVPAGCALRYSHDRIEWNDAGPSPLVHAGPRASYRVDCDTYTGPVTATLSIT